MNQQQLKQLESFSSALELRFQRLLDAQNQQALQLSQCTDLLSQLTKDQKTMRITITELQRNLPLSSEIREAHAAFKLTDLKLTKLTELLTKLSALLAKR